ncbi:hypothetical protein VFPPC_18567 [Pochonia chlamydosporia 170]|uniref:DUF7703 domain-containing protein n=1 Tax=Pochonia chlamydosporia 170 TaxID=1380566 RepID=A0A219ANA3_METCM|nr:hypothetical protein VFPPC_18567 [Pochonia chlamydosporia 170]OWT42317.1 hypothetical protein VFPPC_18567 [Pochonia chlamydosporia 170]
MGILWIVRSFESGHWMRLKGFSGDAPDLVIEGFQWGISLCAVIELNCTILTAFRTRKGFYFWSFVVATNDIAPYSIGNLLLHIVQSEPQALCIALIAIGSVSMVTGQSVVFIFPSPSGC